MKNFILFLIAAFLGGFLSFLMAYAMFNKPINDHPKYTAQLVEHINVSPRSINQAFDFKKAASTAIPSVVSIKVKGKGSSDTDFRIFPEEFLDIPEKEGAGSGVIYKSDGYIITNNHVIESATSIEVKLLDNRIYEAEVVGRDPANDLAVIKIEEENLPTLKLADSDEVAVGEWVLAVGNPYDLSFTVTAGIVSAKGRNIELLDGNYAIETFIQTDASINPGNSGGALVDTEGKLIGINTAIATRTGTFQGYAFTIPINLTARIVDDIIEFGSFRRAYLGISTVDMDSELADELKISTTQGVLIKKVTDGGSASLAGLMVDDVIFEVNGRSIKKSTELQEIVGIAKIGETLNMAINRKGKIINVPVKLNSE